MKKWNYKLKNGLNLRKAIEEDNSEKVLKTLIECYEEIVDYEIKQGITKQDQRDINISHYIFDILNLLEDTKFNQDDIKYQLSNFYDLCDNMGIRVTR